MSAGQPPLADLLHLVDRAADGRLLPGEAEQLRTALRSARSSAGGLQTALHTERARLSMVRAQLDAAAHLLAAARGTSVDMALSAVDVEVQRRAEAGEQR